MLNHIKFETNRPIDVIPLGRITIDLNPVDFGESFVESSHFVKYVGGSPANTAVGLSRLGKKVGFIGKVSDDSLGDYVIKYFKDNGIDVSNIFRCENGETLGLTFTEVLPEKGTNLMMYRNGAVADLQLSLKDIDEEYIKQAKSIVISGTSLAASPSREAAFKALELAKKNGLVVIFDIDYRPIHWKSPEEISIYCSFAAKQADIIMGSREEYDLMESLVSQSSNDLETAQRWFSQGSKVIIIKHGKEGSRAYACDGRAYTVKPFPVKLLKATGGGDAYASAFIYGIMSGYDLKSSLEMATASASMLVGSHSCSEDMPDFNALKSYIQESKEKHGEVVIED
jgi:5-dehydro-2-deoxygluconokinase